MLSFLDKTGLTHLWDKILAIINTKAEQSELDNLESMINQIRQLPIVDEIDNGKFLRVVSGSWAAENVPNAEEVSF